MIQDFSEWNLLQFIIIENLDSEQHLFYFFYLKIPGFYCMSKMYVCNVDYMHTYL